MEHRHPDDAVEQLGNIHRALAPGGLCVCVTPNRLTGPHDASRHFDLVATGSHLREYTITELVALFRRVGCSRARACVSAGGRASGAPIGLLSALERALGWLPGALGRRLARTRVFRALLTARLVAAR